MKGIGTSVQYYPLHLMSYYKKKFKIQKTKFENANVLKDKVISLPIFPTMANKNISYIINTLKSI